MSPRPGLERWACPLDLVANDGRVPSTWARPLDMPSAGTHSRTCPPPPEATAGHALRWHAPVGILPICPLLGPTTGHVPRCWMWPRDMPSAGTHSWTCPQLDLAEFRGARLSPAEFSEARLGLARLSGAQPGRRDKARSERAVRWLGPPRSRPPNQTPPPPKLVTCLTGLSHAAPGRTQAHRYCGIHE